MSPRGAADDHDGRSTDQPADRSADRLGRLYDAHATAVLAFVRRYVPDAQTAEDLTQETFLRVWNHLDRLDDTGNPRAYLMTTARNLITDRWRRNHHDTPATADQLEQLPATGDDLDAALTGILVTEALGRLTPEHRSVVQLLFYDGWTVTETATLLAIPAGTVKSRSYYALKALRTALDELGVTR